MKTDCSTFGLPHLDAAWVRAEMHCEYPEFSIVKADADNPGRAVISIPGEASWMLVRLVWPSLTPYYTGAVGPTPRLVTGNPEHGPVPKVSGKIEGAKR